MKNLCLALIFIALLVTSFTIKNDDVFANQFTGAWQLKAFNYGQGDGNPNMVTIKVFKDTTFQMYLCTPAASVQTSEGNFKALSDSVYSESITKAHNAIMIGKTYDIKYRINNNTLIMSGSFDITAQDGSTSKTDYTETWQKIEFPPSR